MTRINISTLSGIIQFKNHDLGADDAYGFDGAGGWWRIENKWYT